jgi:hypothetical protein
MPAAGRLPRRSLLIYYSVGLIPVEEDRLATFVDLALERAGVEMDQTDLAVIRAVEAVYGPDRDALMSADLSGMPVEHDLDPSRPPSTRAGGRPIS